ncbi:hypothetical protein KO516_16485 [Citreicella sp. C3M06]|uniref:hypothetical protein n=1 Tax=Citreicella sp. C3M06 TaxID=2841564 RepID=UPI001C0A3357|nr:hypothetical protein [Citreicella sp. C3M06]MBU2962389.1 hypothetical protein [Citreicella sp. C3M06]
MLRLLELFRHDKAPVIATPTGSDLPDLMRRGSDQSLTPRELTRSSAEDELARVVALARNAEP